MQPLTTHSKTSHSAFISALDDINDIAGLQPSAHYFDVLRHLARDIGIPAIHFDSGLLLVGQGMERDPKLLAIVQAAFTAKINISSIRHTGSADVIELINQHEQTIANDDEGLSQEDSIVMFAQIMTEAHALGAEDLYIDLSSEHNSAFCQYKVENELIDHVKWLHDYQSGYSVCAALFDGRESAGQSIGRFDESTVTQHTQFNHVVYDQHGQIAEDYSIRFTKSRTRKIGELLVQLRLHPMSNLRQLDDLAIDDDVLAVIARQMVKSKGVLLTSGPTASGKNTLLMAILLAYPRNKFIQTFESPVEIPLPRQYRNIVQNTINPVLGSKSQLSTIMRQAPNGIYLTEVNDAETAEFLYYIAKSGHFALTTLHANGAVGVVERLVSLGISYRDIGADDATNVIMSQRLVKCLCDHCKVPLSTLAETEYASYQQKCQLLADCDITEPDYASIQVRNPHGCSECHSTGERKGRKVVIECIEVNDIDRQFICAGDMPGWKRHLKQQGFITIAMKLKQLLLNGQIDIQRVMESS